MDPYRLHRIPLPPGFVPDGSDVAGALEASPALLREALDGYVERRRDGIEPGSLRVHAWNPEARKLGLAFEETRWEACRLETTRAPRTLELDAWIDGDAIVLRTLPRDAFGERVDEL